MKLQEMINETIIEFYDKVEHDVQNDTGESILPLSPKDVSSILEAEIGHAMKQIEYKSDLVPVWMIEEVVWQAFDKLDFKALANKVNKELCKE